ncbi:hypothetical protein QH494_04155 [Sphingomonas sp. AR_OL41]|uniref:hypothetical protein n=1 Tax=Sphingomonas sp. AR_OL41 TaxID=3042729 RepID=UPI0024804748|nr:hypothetical protein [Sphingomonas sp. AR_OL41]MDH7971364.1 hypothetical protein [Sphingomonas sp. AR_OL41]
MPQEEFPAALCSAPDLRTIAAPHASDAFSRVFRTAFAASDDLPDDFTVILAQLDRATSVTR